MCHGKRTAFKKTPKPLKFMYNKVKEKPVVGERKRSKNKVKSKIYAGKLHGMKMFLVKFREILFNFFHHKGCKREH